MALNTITPHSPLTTLMHRKLAWISAFFAVLVAVSSAWAPPFVDQPGQPKLDAAAERQAATQALKLIEEKQFAKDASELEPIVESRHLPVAIAKAIPELRANLLRLVQIGLVTPEGELPPADSPNLPRTVNAAIGRVQMLRRVEPMFAASDKSKVAEMNQQLEKIASSLGPDIAGKLRVELSAACFLAGKTTEALVLLENDVHPEHGRQVLADLQKVVLGGGTIETAQLAKLVPAEQVPAVVAPLLPPQQRKDWKSPKVEAGPTTLAMLEKRARKELTTIAAEETLRLTEKVNKSAAAMRAELAK
jgi:hypothetical protein